MTAVRGFFGPFRFLSNFHPVEVMYEGTLYPSTEHAYQAAKTLDQELRQQFALAKTPSQVKKLGKTVKLRSDWDDVKLGVMLDVLRLKFQQEPFKRWLLATGDMYLEETNHWGDVYWGVCRGVGTNYLGQLLMLIRDELEFKFRLNTVEPTRTDNETDRTQDAG